MVSNSKSVTQSKFNALELLARIRADNVLSSSSDTGHKQPNVSRRIAGLDFNPDNNDPAGPAAFDSNNRDDLSHNPSIDSLINLKSRDSYPRDHINGDKNGAAFLSSGFDSFDNGGKSRNDDYDYKKDKSIHNKSNVDTQNINSGMYENNQKSNYNSRQHQTPNTVLDNRNYFGDNQDSDSLKKYMNASDGGNTSGNCYKHTYDIDDNDDSVNGKDYFHFILNNNYVSNNYNDKDDDSSRSDNDINNNNNYKENNNNNYNNNHNDNNNNNYNNPGIRNRNDNNNNNFNKSSNNNQNYYNQNRND